MGRLGLGARHLVPLLPLVVLSLAALWEETETQVRGVLVLGIAGFLVQLLGSFVDFNDVLLTLFNAGAGDGDSCCGNGIPDHLESAAEPVTAS